MNKRFKQVETLKDEMLITVGGKSENFMLTELQVLQIVKEWYTGGMFTEILQDAYGQDLEEIIEKYLND